MATDTCRICLGELSPGEETHTTKCGHTFHKECFDTLDNTYSKAALRCPICNETLRTPVFNSKLIDKEIEDYIEDWGELNCDELIEQIELTYGKKFVVDKNLIRNECEKHKMNGGRRHRSKKIRNNKKKTYRRKRHIKKKSVKRRRTYRTKK
jgi:hypothetical protein